MSTKIENQNVSPVAPRAEIGGALGGQESERPQLLLLYKNVNGEESGKIPCISNFELVKSWFGEANEYGRMRFELYATDLGLIIREVWIPTPPYCWQEEHIYKLLLPEER